MPKKPIKQDIKGPGKIRSKKEKKLSRLRGFKDILFEEFRYWDIVMKKAVDLATVYGFRRIETPIIEHYELFERISGRETEIMANQTYNFIDRGGEKIMLRPESTPGLVRAYMDHSMENYPQPVRMFSIGSNFRFDKLQSGYLRQHTQFDLEMFGEKSAVADAQIILLAYNFFSELQIPVQIQINSIGDKSCREGYANKLVDFYKERGKRSKLCVNCRKLFLKNPIKLLDCKEEECKSIREDAPQIVDFLSDEPREHFIRVLEYLDELEIPYNLNPFLVRGLDYYNRTVFEITPLNEPKEAESENSEKESGDRPTFSLAGGGRYDDLILVLGGQETVPAVGCGIGIERVILKIKENNIPVHEEKADIIFVGQLGDQAKRKAFVLFEEMRRTGYKVRQAFTMDSLKMQLEEAERLGAKLTLIIGQKELIDGTIIIRDMESGTQEVIDYKKIYSELARRLGQAEPKKEAIN